MWGSGREEPDLESSVVWEQPVESGMRRNDGNGITARLSEHVVGGQFWPKVMRERNGKFTTSAKLMTKAGGSGGPQGFQQDLD